MRKRIAVLVAQIDEDTQKKFLKNFITQAYAYDYDVCIFSMLQKYQETPARNVGDSNIYRLINFDLFDAVFILADTILTPGYIPKLLKKVKKNFNGPVLLLDYENDLFESVCQDHYTPVLKIVNHLIEVHGYTDFAFLGGKKGHPHSVQRLNAYRDSLIAHGLPYDESKVYHGNYWYDSAEDYAKYLLNECDHLPRVIVCANDIMAIGVAAYLSEHGVRIPEDVAITGYDSIESGRTSPSPLTSAHIPSGDCGTYCANWIHAKLNNQEIGEFRSNPELFIGASCGCDYKFDQVSTNVRQFWRTQQSAKSMFSSFNHMLEDLMSENRIYNFFNAILSYAYQIKPFHSFDICCNDIFLNSDAFVGDASIRKGYTDKMNWVLRHDDTDGKIDLKNCFETSILTPRLYEERDYPTTFIFTPLYSDDRCFGYSVINYADETDFYTEDYRKWMRDIMAGMEAFYRQRYMLSLVAKIKADQIRDSLTGLYNYTGFLKNSTAYFLSDDKIGTLVSLVAIDIKSTHQLNEVYGREYGERAIRAVAHCIQNAAKEYEISCRMGNDEFLIAIEDDELFSRTTKIIESITEDLKDYQIINDTDYRAEINHHYLSGNIATQEELEMLVNQVIALKNHKKVSTSGKTVDNRELADEIKRNQIVMDILNRNLLTYHYQPIVRTSDGSIFAYEALMRSTVNNISPLQIIQSAQYLNRLSDVERYTLLNVTADVIERLKMFGDAKVFINSLPNIGLFPDCREELGTRLNSHTGRFVIEFTEESQPDDESLEMFKSYLENFGCDIAIDDYGAGYSNTNNLIRYMPRYVKIDRMLISSIQNSPQKQHLVRGITDFAHQNNILALAEGVETKEELIECLNIGIDLLQGYYLGRPQREPVTSIDPAIINEIEEFHLQKLWTSL